jgi:carbon-monoxide dehydrogenase large subunit
MAYMGVVRSAVAHAQLKNISFPSANSGKNQFVAFLSGSEVTEHSGPIPGLMSPPGMKRHDVYALAIGKARYVGEPIAAFVCERRYSVEDAAESIDVEYETLQPVSRVESALTEKSSLLYEEWGDNVCYEQRILKGDVVSAFSKADVIIRERLQIQRQHGCTMEPRGVVATYDKSSQKFTVWSSTQIPHLLRKLLSEALRIPETSMRVIAPDVGGGFGSKGGVLYREEVLACLLAARTGRPIKWVANRSEEFLASVHSREQTHDLELAIDKNGVILGFKDRILADIGAFYTSNLGPPILTLVSLPGPYRITACDLSLRCVVTNKPPTGGYRGYGMPQAFFAIERALDIASREKGLDPVKIRERNLLTEDEFPFKTVTNQTLDSGDYRSALRIGLRAIGYESFRNQQRQQRAKGTYLGIGMSFGIEGTGNDLSLFGAPAKFTGESAIVRVNSSGHVNILTGLSPHGQGAETTLTQLCAEILEIPMKEISVIHGDTATCPHGQGTWGSRSAVVGGMAVIMAAQQLKEKGRTLTAQLYSRDIQNIQYRDGRFFVRGRPHESVSIFDLARNSSSIRKLNQEGQAGFEALSTYSPSMLTYPYGVHIVTVRVEPDNGLVEILKYLVVEDCGRIINPTIVEGQIQGGVAQGIGSALYESLIYDDEAQPLATSFMNYLLPTSLEVSNIMIKHMETRSPNNPFGIKGMGEGGAIPSPPAIANAVEDALEPFKVKIRGIPLARQDVWNLIRDSRSSGPC